MNPTVKPLLCSLLLGALTSPPLIGKEPKLVEERALSDQAVHRVPVAANRVTTISFPSAITAIDGAQVTVDGKSPGLFQISHKPGSSFLSVRSLVTQGATNLNIRWRDKTYVLLLQDSPSPILSLAFRPEPEKKEVRHRPVTPGILMGLLDKAKAYPFLKLSEPEATQGITSVEYGAKAPVMDYNDFEAQLQEVYRFEAEDTLVFMAVLKNKTSKVIEYRPEGFGVRIGELYFSQSISDASGSIPAKGESPVYFAITGTPEGGRNDLSLKNEFVILVDRIASAKAEPTPAKPKSRKGRK